MPFYAFPADVRRILYTTNAIEALNAKLRRAVRASGHFPTDEAAMKLLFLVLNRSEKEWTMPRSRVVHGQGSVRHPVRRALHQGIGLIMRNRPPAHEIPDSPALEKAKLDKEAHGEFDSEHPGYCLAQDTFYVGTLKGVGRVYQQTVIDTYSKVSFAKLYTRKTPLTAADILNDRVIPFFDEHGIRIDRILTDRGTEYCGAHDGAHDRHEFELYLAVEDVRRQGQ